MTGLPPEAVEAMARAMSGTSPEHSDQVTGVPWEVYERDARRVLAALPDGVYVIKDGQVTYQAPTRQTWLLCLRYLTAWIEPSARAAEVHVGRHWHADSAQWCEGTPVRVAALSATDTEAP